MAQRDWSPRRHNKGVVIVKAYDVVLIQETEIRLWAENPEEARIKAEFLVNQRNKPWVVSKVTKAKDQ